MGVGWGVCRLWVTWGVVFFFGRDCWACLAWPGFLFLFPFPSYLPTYLPSYLQGGDVDALHDDLAEKIWNGSEYI